MELIEKMVAPGWDHDEGADRVEAICAYDPEVGANLGKIAKAFIASRDLEDEFNELVEQADVFLAVNPKKGDEDLGDEKRATRYAIRFIQEKGLSTEFANAVEAYDPSAETEEPDM